jgi:hypothetical protein
MDGIYTSFIAHVPNLRVLAAMPKRSYSLLDAELADIAGERRYVDHQGWRYFCVRARCPNNRGMGWGRPSSFRAHAASCTAAGATWPAQPPSFNISFLVVH